MPEKNGFLHQLNIPGQCRKYGLPIWQCPQFLFLIMGLVIIGASVVSYAVGARYLAEPEIVALVVLLVTSVLFILAFTIVRNFERLAEVSRMKTEFVNVVSHQLRSPLSNLKWALELLMSGRLGKIEEKQIEYFKILKENNSRMQELVSDLLTVSRIETATLALKKKEISLEELTKKIISEFNIFANASNVDVKLLCDQGLPKLWLDPSQIALVIENFLDNAIRYIKEKGKVEISLKKTNNKLLFQIKDNGVGIPKEDQKYIFQKFFRSENILRYQTHGSGLGLYIAKAIIKKSGGKLWFESQQNKGSTFYFSLPIK